MLLDDTTLRNSLETFLQTLQASYLQFNYPFFKTLYDHGFRVNELFTLHNSYVDENKIVHCITSKGNPTRLIPIDMFHEVVQNSIRDNKNYFALYKVDHYFDCFKYLYEYKNVTIGNHPKSLHLFRHNVARQTYLLRNSLDDVMHKIGVTKEDTARIYVFSLIYGNI